MITPSFTIYGLKKTDDQVGQKKHFNKNQPDHQKGKRIHFNFIQMEEKSKGIIMALRYY